MDNSQGDKMTESFTLIKFDIILKYFIFLVFSYYLSKLLIFKFLNSI